MSDLNEAVRIAYEQGRQDALEVLDKIRDEIKAEIKEHRDIGDIDDFSTGVRYGLRSAIGIIERRTNDL